MFYSYTHVPFFKAHSESPSSNFKQFLGETQNKLGLHKFLQTVSETRGSVLVPEPTGTRKLTLWWLEAVLWIFVTSC